MGSAKFIQSFAAKRRRREPNAVQELSKALRSDLVPAALRDAARTIASLLDGADENASGTAKGAIVINVSVAVAVGAPSKEQGRDDGSDEPTPNDAVVIASAIASGPPLAKSSHDARDAAEPEGATQADD